MGSVVHAIKYEKGFLYREYSETSDMYQTPALTEDEMIFYLTAMIAISGSGGHLGNPLDFGQIPERLKRARQNGTSNRINERDLGGWTL